LRAEGLEPITIPAWARRLDERTSTALMIAENEIRMDDPPIQKAEKMRRLVEGGRTVSAVAQLFGCSEQTVANFLRLLDAVAPVRDAVDAGTITATTARQVADLKPDQQREVVAKLAAVADQPAHKRAAAQREIIKSAKPEVAEPSKPTMRSKASIQARIAAGQDSPPVLRALRWVLGADA
jgi:ParB family chromosome partitioning protein